MVVTRGPTVGDKVGEIAIKVVSIGFWVMLGGMIVMMLLSVFLGRETVAFAIGDVMPGRFRGDVSHLVRAVTVPVGFLETQTGWGADRVKKVKDLASCMPNEGRLEMGAMSKDGDVADCLNDKASWLPFTDYERSKDFAMAYDGSCRVVVRGPKSKYVPTRIIAFGTVKNKWDTKYGTAKLLPASLYGYAPGGGTALLEFDDVFCEFWRKNARDIEWRVHSMRGVRLTP